MGHRLYILRYICFLIGDFRFGTTVERLPVLLEILTVLPEEVKLTLVDWISVMLHYLVIYS